MQRVSQVTSPEMDFRRQSPSPPSSALPGTAAPVLSVAALEPVMLAFWAKAQVDFLAPMVWDGAVSEDERMLVGSALSGLLACVLWLASLFAREQGSRVVAASGLAQAALWTAGGGLMASASQFPPWPRQHQRAEDLVAAGAAWMWVLAGLLWLATAARLLPRRRAVEWIVLALWTGSAVGMTVATALPSAPAADKWTYSSSAVWGVLGCACWAAMLYHGQSLLGC